MFAFHPEQRGSDRGQNCLDELEDDAFPSAAEDIFSRVELPARSAPDKDKPPVSAALGFFFRLNRATASGNACQQATNGTRCIPVPAFSRAR
jgi:hypothetical protein